MTRLRSGSVVATVCYLLGVATSTSAQGAWTLWMMGASSPWDAVGTFASRELCMEALHQQAQAVEKLGLKVTEDVPGGSFVATGADQDVRGQCLPPDRRPARAEAVKLLLVIAAALRATPTAAQEPLLR